ncbi:hypothetical protein Cgig2_017836 [Carnegiea gigantea]|uniref:Structural maintenance of chromosomes protein 5 n=1 Tax=Carnegiea gigantea TaxID=171969 RepID=A0A9Q1KX12_9CARY|nr:hypothetical protein Cgig2_017836 [Carnegiea gigantea]
MSKRRAKRPKISGGEDDYFLGNTTEIELHNFMTFSYLKCKPGSRLNLVIGPNGSGKSSIVYAIALGLGGDPQAGPSHLNHNYILLRLARGMSRAGSVGAYVKRGEESGHIKITVRGDSREEQICITRKIDTTSKSGWLLKGRNGEGNEGIMSILDDLRWIEGFPRMADGGGGGRPEHHPERERLNPRLKKRFEEIPVAKKSPVIGKPPHTCRW